MCGIAGFLGGNASLDENRHILYKMINSLKTRGPDGEGVWLDGDQKVYLSHKRLSIIDLSSAGHQPMLSESGRYNIVFNGEIYNFQTIRQELDNNQQMNNWRGHSDTEVLLAGFEKWGIHETIKKTVGMFAMAVWDRQTKTLNLIRDRIGEKPLYYGWVGNVFLFGSEIKALKAHPRFKSEIDRNALCLYLRHSYIPAPFSIYNGISKLQPGTILTVSNDQKKTKSSEYWSGTKVAENGTSQVFYGSQEDAVNNLEHLLMDAVRQQMVADVPLGAFLSGGIDSSTIVALMQAQSSRPVKTFSIGFHEKNYNEAIFAKAVANHLGTDHTEMYVTPEEAISVIPLLPKLYCEPFADSSQIPTYLVSKLARQHVTVSLSGDAGDELFCGYNRYILTSKLWQKISLIPKFGRNLFSKSLANVSVQTWNRFFAPIQSVLPNKYCFANIGDKIHKGANVLTCNTASELYLKMVSHWHDPSKIVLKSIEPATVLTDKAPELKGLNNIQKMMVLDMITYLPDDILVKVDRAAMGVSLESRVPFLDHRVIEYAWKLPMRYKLNNGQSKWILRQVLYKYVPKKLIERPKMGFGIPIDTWLCGVLRDWAEDLLSENRIKNDGYFDSILIRQKWLEHQSGKRNWHHDLWNVLMFQAWLDLEKSNL